jgi:hypothetical protein
MTKHAERKLTAAGELGAATSTYTLQSSLWTSAHYIAGCVFGMRHEAAACVAVWLMTWVGFQHACDCGVTQNLSSQRTARRDNGYATTKGTAAGLTLLLMRRRRMETRGGMRCVLALFENAPGPSRHCCSPARKAISRAGSPKKALPRA